MSRTPFTVRLDTTLKEVHALFARSQADVLAVVARDESGWMRRVIGVVTRADLLRYLVDSGPGRAPSLLRTRNAGDVFRRVRALRTSDSLGDATSRLLETGLGALPVVEADGRMSGMLSLGDVLARPLGAARSATL